MMFTSSILVMAIQKSLTPLLLPQDSGRTYKSSPKTTRKGNLLVCALSSLLDLKVELKNSHKST